MGLYKKGSGMKLPINMTDVKNLPTQIQNLRSNDAILSTSFNGLNGQYLDIYVSYDRETFIPINKNILFNALSGAVRDTSPLFYQGKLYVAFTTSHDNKIGIAYTDNLIDWTVTNAVVDLSGIGNLTTIWSPQWSKDENGDIYLCISVNVNNETTTDKYSASVSFFSSYYMKMTSDPLHFSAPVKIQFSDMTENRIDPVFIYANSNYYLFVKDENNKVIKQYSAASLSGTFSNTVTLGFSEDVEGPAITYYNNKYYVYADEYLNGISVRMETSDFSSWTNETVIKASDGTRMQHFDVCSIDAEAAAIVEKGMHRLILENIGSKEPYKKNFSQTLNLEDYVSSGVFTPHSYDATYTVSGSDTKDIVISSIAGVSDSKKHTVKILLWTDTKRVIIANNGSGGLGMPNFKPFIIAEETNLINVPVSLVFDNGMCRVEGIPATSTDFQKGVLLNSGTIDNLQVTDNTFYYINTGAVTTINSIDTSKVPNNAKIKFLIGTSESGAAIIIKNGAGIITPGYKDLILTRNDIIYTFEKGLVDGNFRMNGEPYINEQNYTEYMSPGTITNLAVKDNMTYYILDNETSTTINGLDLSGLSQNGVFYMCKFATSTSPGNIVLKHGNNMICPGSSDYSISTGDLVYKFRRYTDGVRICM